MKKRNNVPQQLKAHKYKVQIGWLTQCTYTKRLCTGTHTFKNTALLIRPKQELFKKKKRIQQVILV